MKELARLVGVSKSSISLWVRDIELTEAQRSVLRRRIRTNGWAGSALVASRARARRQQAQEHGRELAQRAEPLHVAGCMLFWAEGSRKGNVVEFVNSDPAMVKFFARFLRTCFAVPDEKFRITCNLFADHRDRQREIEQFWLDLLDLPRTCLCRSSVNVYSKYSKKKRRNMLPFGTCRIAVHDTRIEQSIYGAIQEYAGFDRAEWLR